MMFSRNRRYPAVQRCGPAHGIRSARLGLIGFVTAMAVSIAACAVDPAALPTLSGGVRTPAYRLHIQFPDALNLPSGARVVADGVPVGKLTAVALVAPDAARPGFVLADVDIDADVRLSGAVTAQLRQDTPLGDVYIALETPAGDAGPALSEGATIPLDQTRPAVQVEDTMAGLAAFVRGGTVTRLQDILNQVNAALPADPRETARLRALFADNVTDLGDHLDSVDALLAATASDLDAVRANASAIREHFSAAGADQVATATASVVRLLGLLPAVGTLPDALVWLSPLAQAGDASAAALLPLLFTTGPLDTSAPSNLNRLVALLDDRILPWAEHGPTANVTEFRTATTPAADSAPEMDAILAALRMVGVVR